MVLTKMEKHRVQKKHHHKLGTHCSVSECFYGSVHVNHKLCYLVSSYAMMQLSKASTAEALIIGVFTRELRNNE